MYMQTLVGSLVLLVALGAGAWLAHFKYIFNAIGWLGRDIRILNTASCNDLPGLTACEKIVLHQPTRHVFAACSTSRSRTHWLPAVHHLNASGRATDDFIAVLDPASHSVRNLTLSGFTDRRGLNSHGMDVVPSATSTSELFVYLVNQRPPFGQLMNEHVEFPNPSVEIFCMNAITANTLEHIATIAHPLVRSPNDVVGSTDGKSFWVTNDGSHQRGFAHHAKLWLKCKKTTIVHCAVGSGCKIAAAGLSGSNGLARSVNGETFYVANALFPEVKVLARQADDTLVVTDMISVGLPQDNLSVDSDDGVWAAAVPLTSHRRREHFTNPEIVSASTALRITLNSSRSAFFGEKYKVTKTLEDDGHVVSGATTVVYDAQREWLFTSSGYLDLWDSVQQLIKSRLGSTRSYVQAT